MNLFVAVLMVCFQGNCTFVIGERNVYRAEAECEIALAEMEKTADALGLPNHGACIPLKITEV